MTRQTNIEHKMNKEKRAYQTEAEAKGHREYFNLGKEYVTKIVLGRIKEFVSDRRDDEHARVIYELYREIEDLTK